MAAISSILLASAIAGTAISAGGAVMQYSAQKDMTKASQKAEAARAKQMELENSRRQRDIFRKMQIARATSLSTSAAQGAQFSSGFEGSKGQISTQTGQELLASSENTEIGRDIFAANADYADASGRSATGKSITGFGSGLIQNSERIGQLGAQLFPGLGSSSSNRNSYYEPSGN